MASNDMDRLRLQRQREEERARKAREARQKEKERQVRQAHIDSQKAQAAHRNQDLEARVHLLQSFLVAGLPATESMNLSSLRRAPAQRTLQLGSLEHAVPAPRWEDYQPTSPGFWKRTLGQASIEAESARAKRAFEQAQAVHAGAERDRQRRVSALRGEHEAAIAKAQSDVDRHNRELDEMIRRAGRREKSAVEEFLLRIIALVPIPKFLAGETKIVFDPKSEQIVLEVELPRPASVPAVKSFGYVQSRNELVEKPRPAKEQAEIYRGVIGQLCLLMVRALFNADRQIVQASFNGRVRHINSATGHEERPHILSVVIEREAFESLVLNRVKPEDCLRHLRALVSPHPFELEPVEPLVEFDKSRLAFIEGLGVVSGLDARPDLMAMSPTEFEHLISELLEADPSIESVESLTTRQSNDGGVDGVVYIKQPFGRSMTVVQAKQYARNRNLGPAHVRELIGAMHEVKAGNGLLVTTSDFTAIARANAAEFGRIQLIDGNNLVHMIKRLLDKDVLIGEKRK